MQRAGSLEAEGSAAQPQAFPKGAGVSEAAPA